MISVNDFIKQLQLAVNSKTLYVMGGIGYRLNATGKKRALKNAYNARPDRSPKIETATDDTWAFDCNCLIKAILWGWNAEQDKVYGGANYASNGLEDASIQAMVKTYGYDNTVGLGNIEIGEYLYTQTYGHAGIYIGKGQVIECTPAYKGCVQITKITQQKWYGHCKLKLVDYTTEQQITKEQALLAIETLQKYVKQGGQ